MEMAAAGVSNNIRATGEEIPRTSGKTFIIREPSIAKSKLHPF